MTTAPRHVARRADRDDLKQYVADELERSRDRSARPHHRRPRRDRAARPALPADVAAGVGPRARRQLRGAVAAARGGRHRGDAARDRRHLRRVRAPAGRAADAAAAAARPRPATTSAWCAARCSTRSTRCGCDAGGPAARRRVRLRHGAPARAPARRDDAGDPPAASRRPGAARRPTPLPAPPAALIARPRCSCPAGPFTMGTSTDSWAYDNERPAHQVDVPAFFIDTVPVSNAAYRAFVEAGGYDDERLWTRGRLALALRVRQAVARVLAPRRRRAGCAAASAGSSRCPTTSRCSTSAGSRPTPTPAGPAGGCRPRPSGRRPPPGTPRPGTQARFPWGDEAPTERHANLGQTPLPARPRPARSPRARRRAARCRWSATCGSGPSTEFTGYPGFRSFPYKEYSEVFFGDGYKVLRGGSLGHRPAGLPHHLPQLGPPDPPADLRRLPDGRDADVPAPGLPRRAADACSRW